MIGRISGILLEKKPPFLLIDINGLGYELQVSLQTFSQLPPLQERVILLTHFIVREDAQLLFGFFDEAERHLFRELIKVSGVGPKMAMAILSSVTVSEFINMIQSGDTDRLTRIPGIGKKTAERLIVETRDRLKNSVSNTSSYGDILNPKDSKDSPVSDAVNALIALGYKPHQASQAVNRFQGKSLSSEELIRLALQGVATS